MNRLHAEHGILPNNRNETLVHAISQMTLKGEMASEESQSQNILYLVISISMMSLKQQNDSEEQSSGCQKLGAGGGVGGEGGYAWKRMGREDWARMDLGRILIMVVVT